MKRCSSKYLNLYALQTAVDASSSSDSVILITNFGYIVGELDFNDSEDNYTVSNIISNAKSKIIETEEFDLIGDGSMICVKNAIVKYSNNMTINFKEFTVHSDDIVGFSPINKEDFLSQLS